MTGVAAYDPKTPKKHEENKGKHVEVEGERRRDVPSSLIGARVFLLDITLWC